PASTRTRPSSIRRDSARPEWASPRHSGALAAFRRQSSLATRTIRSDSPASPPPPPPFSSPARSRSLPSASPQPERASRRSRPGHRPPAEEQVDRPSRGHEREPDAAPQRLPPDGVDEQPDAGQDEDRRQPRI